MGENEPSTDLVQHQIFKEGSVNSDEAILGLKELNGLPIEILEERLRPKGIKGAFVGFYSYDGFIGEDESLIEVLLEANQTVRERGYTHEILANWLDLAMLASQSSEGKFSFNEMEFEVFCAGTVSRGQESPFKNSELENDPEADGWDGHYWVKKLTTGRNFEFTPPIPRWARKYGFYEGDSPYRVDPALVIDTFTRKDRVYKTKEEHSEQLKAIYTELGWKEVIIGDQEIVFYRFPQLYLDLTKYQRDQQFEDRIAQYLEDDNFIVVTLGEYNPFTECEFGIAVYDSKVPNSPLLVLRSLGRYDIKRTDEVLDITIRELGREQSEPAKIMVFNEQNNGWIIRQSGGIEHIGDLNYLSEYGFMNVNDQTDTFDLYKNSQLDFMVQKRNDQAIFFYKKDKGGQVREVVLLTKDNLKDRLQISDEYLNGDCIISEVKEVSVTEEGVVKGKVVIDGREVSFMFQ